MNANRILVCWLPLILFSWFSILQATEQPSGFLNSLEPYRDAYFVNTWFLNSEGSEQGYQNQEMIVRFSFKQQIVNSLYFGYSHKAFWQVYDLSNSRPFREQNYNPELFIDFGRRWHFDRFQLGLLEHESNGEQMRYDRNGNPVNHSRTWDRSYLLLEKQLTESLTLALKTWVVVSPRMKDYRAFYDDNPDMQQYMGSGELRLEWLFAGTQTRLMLRRGWREGTETAQADILIPLSLLLGENTGDLAFLLQAFSGYGDSLIDYNRKVTRVAAGLSFH